MSAVSLSSTSMVISSPYDVDGADFLGLLIDVSIGSFTSITITADVLTPTGLWRNLYDPALVLWRIVLSATFSGAVPIGAQSAATNTRVSQLPLSAVTMRFSVVPSGSAATPASITLRVTPFRRPAGAYQSR
jgi:hypothetical protein